MQDKNPLAHYSGVLSEAVQEIAEVPDQAQIKALMRKHRIWIEHSTLLEDDLPARELRAVQAEQHQFEAFVQDLIALSAAKTTPKSDYLEGVSIPNLREALIFLGRENGVGEGEVGDKLAQYVNSVVSGVLSEKAALRATSQATPAAVAVPDERAAFDDFFRKRNGLHPDTNTTFRSDAAEPWRYWQARAALAAAPATLDAQKPVFVLGSAPNAAIPSDIGRYFVIAANGAIAAFPDLVPDVLILNGWSLVDASGVGPETRAQLRGRRVKRLVVIDNLKPSDKSTARRVLELGIQYEHVEFWSKVERAEICSNASGIQYAGLAGNDIPSTGVTAICYAISLSKDVTVSGINIESSGHSYSNGNYKRDHIEVDGKTLKAIAGKFRTPAAAAPVVTILKEPAGDGLTDDTEALQAGCALLATATGLPAQAVKTVDFPSGAILNGRAYAERLETYGFECEAGSLSLCSDWQEFRRCFEFLAEWASLQAPQAQADARDAEQEVLMEHSGCGSNTQVDMLTVRLNPGDKVVMHKGRITQGFDRANRAAIAAAKGEGQC